MASDHETAYQALADRLTDALGTTVKTAPCYGPGKRSRVRSFANVDPQTEQPAVFLLETHQTPTVDPKHLPARWVFGATAIIYACPTDDRESAGSALNTVVAAVESALLRQANEFQGLAFMPGQMLQAWTTLGGAVSYACPGGPVEFEAGSEGRQGIAYFPIEMGIIPQET